MTISKRILDLVIIFALMPILLPLGVVFALLILVRDGRPVFYVQERMKTMEQGFQLWKFRTMTVVDGDSGVSGGNKLARITKLGRLMRRTHADEIPQAINVIRGDVSLVGPRPPLRDYVERFPEVYRDALKSRPGLTGMASFFFSVHEARILRDCGSAEETDAAYTRRCIPRKARLDLIYQRNRTIWLDLWLMGITILRIFRLYRGRRR